MTQEIPNLSLSRPLLVKRPHQAAFFQDASGETTVRVGDDGLEFVISSDVAACLKALDGATEVTRLFTEWGLTRATIARLLDARLLLEIDEETPEADVPLADFFPRFLSTPRAAAGEAQITILGAPTDLMSQTGSGARGGPASLRTISSQMEYSVDAGQRSKGWFDYASGSRILEDVTMADAGDIAPSPGEPAEVYGRRIYRCVRRCAALGSIPVILGGDHSVSYWAVSGMLSSSRGPVSVLHLDAHSDLSARTASCAPTNGSVVRWLQEEYPQMTLLTVGLKGFHTARQPSLGAGHRLVSAADAIREGSEWVLSHLPATSPCYVSLDIDVLDPSAAPATNTPVPGGFSFEFVRDLLCTVARDRRVIGVDVVELNPERDHYLRSAACLVHLLMGLLGSMFPSSQPLGV